MTTTSNEAPCTLLPLTLHAPTGTRGIRGRAHAADVVAKYAARGVEVAVTLNPDCTCVDED